MDFSSFFYKVCSEPFLLFSLMLVCGVIFVNGWTDAPNAITASVSTGALTMRHAVIIAAIFNFLGALIMGMANTSVLRSVGNITMLIGFGGHSLIVLCAALISIILWAVLAWYFGIPTSESHALISGVLGAAIACGSDISAESLTALKLSAVGLGLSLPIGGVLGWITAKVCENVFFNAKKPLNKFQMGQKIGAAAMAFMHGAQDSQKFAGVFIAALCMSDIGNGEVIRDAPLWLILVCAAIIALGTSVGGYRIIKKVGMETVELTPSKGLAADISAVICMLSASLGGIPVSTTHTSTAAIIGAGLSNRTSKINKKAINEMLIAWILTFPGCGLLSYTIVKILMLVIN